MARYVGGKEWNLRPVTSNARIEVRSPFRFSICHATTLLYPCIIIQQSTWYCKCNKSGAANYALLDDQQPCSNYSCKERLSRRGKRTGLAQTCPRKQTQAVPKSNLLPVVVESAPNPHRRSLRQSRLVQVHCE